MTKQSDMTVEEARKLVQESSNANLSEEKIDKAYYRAVVHAVENGEGQETLDRLKEAKSVLANEAARQRRIKENRWNAADTDTAIDEIVEHAEYYHDLFAPPNMKYMYEEGHNKACYAYDQPVDIDYPAPHRTPEAPIWYKIIRMLCAHFPWRIAFIALVLWISSWTVDWSMSNMSDGLNLIFPILVIVIIIAINTATGFLTDILRTVLFAGASVLLQKQVDVREKSALKKAIENGTAIGVIENSKIRSMTCHDLAKRS